MTYCLANKLLTKISNLAEDILMVYYIGSYPECTSSVLQALILFRELYPSYRTEEINKSVRKAATFIESRQKEDGSWFVLMRHLLTYLTHIYFTSTIDNTLGCLAG